MTNVVFGAATRSSQLPEGILGLGFGNGVNLQYNNFVDTLFEQNVTRSRAFTIALGSADANNGGAIVFGGVDAKRFSGNLTKIPILGPQGKETIRRYWVQLQGISNGGSGKAYTGSSMPIVIDSGSSLSFLPKTVVDQMANDTGAQWDSQAEVYIVPCSLLFSRGSFDFTFGGGSGGSSTAKISVPYREFIWQAGSECALGAVPFKSSSSGGVTALLGDSFMRAASVTFDQTSNSIYLAQYASCGDGGVRAITTDAAGLAGMAGECSQGQGLGSAAGGGSGNKNAAAATAPRSLWFGVAVVVAQAVMGVL